MTPGNGVSGQKLKKASTGEGAGWIVCGVERININKTVFEF